MASKELIEKVARALYRSDFGNEFGFHQKEVAKVYSSNAEAAISTILAALQDLTEAMEQAHDLAHAKAETFFADTHDVWSAMLAASALGEQSE